MFCLFKYFENFFFLHSMALPINFKREITFQKSTIHEILLMKLSYSWSHKFIKQKFALIVIALIL